MIIETAVSRKIVSCRFQVKRPSSSLAIARVEKNPSVVRRTLLFPSTLLKSLSQNLWTLWSFVRSSSFFFLYARSIFFHCERNGSLEMSLVARLSLLRSEFLSTGTQPATRWSRQVTFVRESWKIRGKSCLIRELFDLGNENWLFVDFKSKCKVDTFYEMSNIDAGKKNYISSSKYFVSIAIWD